MTYAASGVNYDEMDPFKRAAQTAGRATASNIARLSGGEFKEYESSRGESAYIIEAAKSYFVHVEEGLGTKNLVADKMRELTGRDYYDQIAEDTVAMIVNDMITVGGLPLSVAMHLSVGDSNWFNDESRSFNLIKGWQKACSKAGCVWGGGETPTLKGIVNPGTCVLSGSAMGQVKPKSRLIEAGKIIAGDIIILIGSSGIHANGLTLARQIAERRDSIWRRIAHFFFPKRYPLKALPKGYLTRLSDGRTYGESLLDPTLIYVRLVEVCLDRGVDVHYAVNITGHGFRKLMRASQSFKYVIEHLPKPQPIFDFIMKHGPVSLKEMYGNYNMGVGFALYVKAEDVQQVLAVANELGYTAVEAGHIETSQTRSVALQPLGIEYGEEELQVR